MGDCSDDRQRKESTPTLYEVLGLQNKAATNEQIKAAYRQALLQHHPDKKGTSPQAKVVYSIDEVTHARQVLLNRRLRAEYDQSLASDQRLPRTQTLPLNPTELETVDLDDMMFSERSSCWHRPCRCGNTSAYEFSESDLEEELNARVGAGSQRGEILVGCGDCSLYIRVVFEALDED